MAVYHPEEDMEGEFRHFIESSHNDLEVHGATTPEGLRALIGDIEVLVAFRPPMDMLAQAQNLKWLHYTSAGVDGLMPARDILRDVAVTNSTGIHSIMADYCICTMLMLHWRFPRLHEDQKARLWRPFRTAPMEEFTVGVIGLGSVGQAIVKRAQGFSMNVLGMRRTPRSTPGVAKVFGSEQMDEMLPQCDFLMLATPGTPDTAKLIGQRELALMKPSAYLINVGRGNVVDEPSLIAAVQSGQIAGAALDVFEQEPLPKDSPLWDMENVIVTPHISGTTTRYAERVISIFGANLKKYRLGEPLPNAVNLDQGY